MRILTFVFAAALSAFCVAPTFAGENGNMDMEHGQAMEGEDWGREDDAVFLSSMIAHHRAALEMSEPLLASEDPAVRKWAGDIIAKQRNEIAAMEALLPEVGGRDAEAEDMMRKHMESMTAQVVSDNPEVNFVVLMVDHHAGAVDMSLPALVLTENGKIRELAKDIIVDQTVEINDFRAWLAGKNLP